MVVDYSKWDDLDTSDSDDANIELDLENLMERIALMKEPKYHGIKEKPSFLPGRFVEVEKIAKAISMPYNPISPLITNSAGRSSSSPLLALPTEIRLSIYDYLLVSRCDPNINPSQMDGDKKKIFLEMPRMRDNRTMEPALLQTCKQIYFEASPILYSQNTHHITNPTTMLAFFNQIGPVHTKELKTLNIWVAYCVSGPWLPFLLRLAQDATGIRNIAIGWGIDEMAFHHHERCGLGDDVSLVRALGKIQGLEKLELIGFYAKRWPEYLEKTTGALVTAYRPWNTGFRDEDSINLFLDYQMATEDLCPDETQNRY